jgi:hypothetical protein
MTLSSIVLEMTNLDVYKPHQIIKRLKQYFQVKQYKKLVPSIVKECSLGTLIIELCQIVDMLNHPYGFMGVSLDHDIELATITEYKYNRYSKII